MKRRPHLPNILTLLRLALAAGYLVLIAVAPPPARPPSPPPGSEAPAAPKKLSLADPPSRHPRPPSPSAYRTTLLNIALAIFLIASVTDVLDGYLARRWKAESGFGRVADPFADKVLTSGSFILFASQGLHVQGWMAVVITAREFMVTTLRGFLESRNIAFGATFSGKLKMFLQCAAIVSILIFEAHCRDSWIGWRPIMQGLLWSAVVVTAYSGFPYAWRARRHMLAAPGSPPGGE